jgi:cell division protein FtsB
MTRRRLVTVSGHHYYVSLPGSSRLWRWIFVAALAAGILLTVFLGQKNLPALARLLWEKKQFNEQLVSLGHANQKLSQQINALQADPGAVEPVAREALGLVQPGEIVYRFVSPNDQDAKKP